jgi:hypothetical protein
VEPQEKSLDSINLTDFLAVKTQYVKDKSSDLFIESPWYIYDENNHIIWPIFSVYGIRSQGNYYKFQIINYYDSAANPGIYSLRIADELGNTKEYQFEAQGCGNVYTNRDFENCVLDPQRNIYTYLDLKTGLKKKLSDADAKEDLNWDIAFNGTNIRLNSGKYGNKGVQAANLFVFSNFYKNGTADFQRIAEVSFSTKGSEFFNLDLDPKSVPYSLPPGVSRVINEPDWYIEDQQTKLRSATGKNWWLIKSSNGNSFIKFNISSIHEQIVEEGKIETIMTFQTYHQGQKDQVFNSELRQWQAPTLSSKKRLVRVCYDLDTEEVVNCKSKAKWDIKFTALNKKTRKWKIEVANGAIGPLSFDDIDARNSGRGL